jgi:cytochrome c553
MFEQIEFKGLSMRLSFFAVFLAFGVHTSLFAADVGLVGNSEAGQTKSAACVACHGVDGNSVDPQYAKIAGQHADYLVRHLHLFKSGERENAIMAAQAALLSDQDMSDVAAYFATQKIRAGITDEPLVARGQALYRGGAGTIGASIPSCMGCHGPAGRGNPAAKYPLIAGQHGAYIKTQLERFRAGMVYGKDDNANKLIMSQVAKNLSDADIEALSSYIEGLHTAQ